MSGEEYKALVRETVLEIWNKGNLAAIDKAYAPDYVGHDPASPESTLDREGLKQFVLAYRNAFPDLRVTVEDQLCDGNKVVTRYVARGTHRGEFMGIAPTDKPVTVSGIGISCIARGKIAEEWDSYDALGILQQIGALPSPYGKGD